jgi:hypothetical protein
MLHVISYITAEMTYLYWTKKISNVLMLSSTSLKLYHIHMWVCGVEGWDQGKGWGQWIVGNEAVDSQLGTRVTGSSHPCYEGHHPK